MDREEIYTPISKVIGVNPLKWEVSNLGNVRKIGSKKLRKLCLGSHGYKMLNLTVSGRSKTFTVHRLVALHFIPNPKNKSQVNHIDGEKLNNSVSNLEWVTHSENLSHARKTVVYKKKKFRRPFTIKEIKNIRSMKGKYTYKQIGDRFETNQSSVCAIINFKRRFVN